VFKADGSASISDTISVLNQGLVALNFRREPVYLAADTLASEARYRHYAIALRNVPAMARVREGFVGRAIHTTIDAWARQLDRLVQ
jgi:hypothetical protein